MGDPQVTMGLSLPKYKACRIARPFVSCWPAVFQRLQPRWSMVGEQNPKKIGQHRTRTNQHTLLTVKCIDRYTSMDKGVNTFICICTCDMIESM